MIQIEGTQTVCIRMLLSWTYVGSYASCSWQLLQEITVQLGKAHRLTCNPQMEKYISYHSVNSHSSLFHTVPVRNLLMMKSNPKPLEEAQCNVAMENSKRLSQTDMVKMQCT